MRFSTSTVAVASLFAASSAVVSAAPLGWVENDLIARAGGKKPIQTSTGTTHGGTGFQGGSSIAWDPKDIDSTGRKGGKRYDSFDAREYNLFARAGGKKPIQTSTGTTHGGTGFQGGSSIAWDPKDIESTGRKGGKREDHVYLRDWTADNLEARLYEHLMTRREDYLEEREFEARDEFGLSLDEVL